MVASIQLKITNGELRGKTVQVTEREARVGRGTVCDVVIGAPTVSTRHAELQCREDRWYILDLASANGTSVNGQEIEPHVWCDLPVPCRLTLGEVLLEVSECRRMTLEPPTDPRGGPMGTDDELVRQYITGLEVQITGLKAENAQLGHQNQELQRELERCSGRLRELEARPSGPVPPLGNEARLLTPTQEALTRFGDTLIELNDLIKTLARQYPDAPEVAEARALSRRTILWKAELEGLIKLVQQSLSPGGPS